MIENALSSGDTVLIENIEESLDPVLGSLLGRETIKKGRLVKNTFYNKTVLSLTSNCLLNNRLLMFLMF